MQHCYNLFKLRSQRNILIAISIVQRTFTNIFISILEASRVFVAHRDMCSSIFLLPERIQIQNLFVYKPMDRLQVLCELIIFYKFLSRIIIHLTNTNIRDYIFLFFTKNKMNSMVLHMLQNICFSYANRVCLVINSFI